MLEKYYRYIDSLTVMEINRNWVYSTLTGIQNCNERIYVPEGEGGEGGGGGVEGAEQIDVGYKIVNNIVYML